MEWSMHPFPISHPDWSSLHPPLDVDDIRVLFGASGNFRAFTIIIVTLRLGCGPGPTRTKPP